MRTKMMAGLAGVAAVVAMVAGTATSQAATPLPVPHTLLAGVIAESTNPGSSPPGSNNFACKPSAVHPEPVVLVHGLSGDKTDNWPDVSPLLANAGYCVFALTYGVYPTTPFPANQVGGVEPMEQSARQLGAFINQVLTATGARKVDIVGHSEGATMPDYYALFDGGAAKIDRYVGIAGVLHGTNLLGAGTLETLATAYGFGSVPLPFCGSCSEFLTGSPFITKLDAAGLAAPGVTYTMIATRYDELVNPYNSGFINSPRATDITVQDQCPLDFSDHLAVVADPTTDADVLNALDPAHHVPVPCQLVLPFIG
jgi:triacylglycerol esterase/lipase EstA (alpha/beta hydrolase family)